MNKGILIFKKNKLEVCLLKGEAKALEISQVLSLEGISELAQLEKKYFFSKIDFIVLLDDGAVGIRQFSFPFSQTKKICEVLPNELSGLVLESLEELCFSFSVPVASGDSFMVVAGFTQRKFVVRILEELAVLNIYPSKVVALNFFQALCVLKRIACPNEAQIYSLAQQEPFDLTPQSFAKKSFEKSAGYQRVFGLALLLAVLLALFFGFKVFCLAQEVNFLRQDLERVTKQVFSPQEVKGFYQMQAKVLALKKRKDFVNAVSGLDFLSQLSRQGFTVKLASFQLDKTRVSLKGKANDSLEIDKVKAFLGKVGGKEVKLQTAQAIDTGVTFSLEAGYE